MTKTGQISYWACYHKNLGWLNFVSGNHAEASLEMDVKCLYSSKKLAERRVTEVFHCKAANSRKYKERSGADIQVVEVKLDWQADIQS